MIVYAFVSTSRIYINKPIFLIHAIFLLTTHPKIQLKSLNKYFSAYDHISFDRIKYL